MNIRIDIECTPEEFKELFVPSERQAEFAVSFQQAMMTGMQRAMAESLQQAFSQQFNPFTSAMRPKQD